MISPDNIIDIKCSTPNATVQGWLTSRSKYNLGLLKNLKFYLITRSFAKAKRRGDLKTIRAEIATAP